MEHQNTGSIGSAIQDMARDPKAAADEAAKHVGDRLNSAADQLRARVPDRGIAGQVGNMVSNGIQQVATRLQAQDFGGMIDDVVVIGRRYPMQAIIVGLGCGYLLSRLRRD